MGSCCGKITDWKNGIVQGARNVGFYRVYVLVLLLLAYLLNQLDRYVLPITTRESARDIGYGDLACFANETLDANTTAPYACDKEKSEELCLAKNPSGQNPCYWSYTGTGFDYVILAGPVFVLVYTFVGVLIGFAADIYSRKLILAVALFLWSSFTLITGFAQEYWQLALLRFGLGFAEAGCTPLAASLITDIFPASMRAAALGIYNWGIYTGYSFSFAIGNLLGLSWRWVYFVAGAPGLVLAFIIAFTIREPERIRTQVQTDANSVEEAKKKPKTYRELLSDGNGYFGSFWLLVKPLLTPTIIMLCIAGAVRNGSGYVWGAYTQPYFQLIGQTKTQIGAWMTPIPLVCGSISTIVGGVISDRLVKKVGVSARIWILVVSQLLAAPFAVGAITLAYPWNYLMLIPVNVIGELWVAVCMAAFVELVPSESRTFAVALYFFVITNIGGNMSLLVPPIKKAFLNSGYTEVASLRGALLFLYPGSYVAGALLFALTIFFINRQLKQEALDEARRSPVTLNEKEETKTDMLDNDESINSKEDLVH